MLRAVPRFVLRTNRFEFCRDAFPQLCGSERDRFVSVSGELLGKRSIVEGAEFDLAGVVGGWAMTEVRGIGIAPRFEPRFGGGSFSHQNDRALLVWQPQQLRESGFNVCTKRGIERILGHDDL